MFGVQIFRIFMTNMSVPKLRIISISIQIYVKKWNIKKNETYLQISHLWISQKTVLPR